MAGRAVILAGGKGSRLRPFTFTIPKPLVPIGDLPIIEILIRQLAASGVDRITLSTGHLAGLAPGPVRFGVRANHLFLSRHGPADLELTATMELAEISGSETFIHAAHSGTSWVVQEEGVHSLSLGEEIRVFVDPRHCFAFDSAGALIAAPGAAPPSLAAQ